MRANVLKFFNANRFIKCLHHPHEVPEGEIFICYNPLYLRIHPKASVSLFFIYFLLLYAHAKKAVIRLTLNPDIHPRKRSEPIA